MVRYTVWHAGSGTLEYTAHQDVGTMTEVVSHDTLRGVAVLLYVVRGPGPEIQDCGP